MITFEILSHGHGHTHGEGTVNTTITSQPPTADPNRRVHAYNQDMDVVRYDRTSKWYLEPVGYPDLPRRKVTIDEAVQYAYLECVDRNGRSRPGASVNLGLPGGNTFDRKFTAFSEIEP